jgi:DNA polymerase/3'-5' exonuclease PolX
MEKLQKYIHYGAKGKILSHKLYKLGCRTRNDLLNHIKSGLLPKLPNISQIYIKYNPKKNIKNNIAKKIISNLNTVISKLNKGKIIPVGSVRREEKTHSDIDLLLVIDNLKDNLKNNLKNNLKDNINISCKNLILVEGKNRHQRYILKMGKINYLIDIFVCVKSELPYMLFHYTGDKHYNIRTRAYAKKKGFLLNQYGLWHISNKKKVLNINSEKDLISYLQISYREPKQRTLKK